MSDYLHGYDPREQDRLIAQAEFWREFILEDLPSNDSLELLEVGCGAGAVLHVIGSAKPQTALHGIDIEAKQIERAKQHLSLLPNRKDLRVGDAAALPWDDNRFDCVFFMWMLEHLRDQQPVLAEALRVLRRGGRVVITETDYNFVTFPENADFIELMRAWRTHFARGGDVTFARRAGPALVRAGFNDVRVRLGAFHAFAGQAGDQLSRNANYHADYIEPEIEKIATAEKVDLAVLQRGVKWLRDLSHEPDASITGTVFRATAVCA